MVNIEWSELTSFAGLSLCLPTWFVFLISLYILPSFFAFFACNVSETFFFFQGLYAIQDASSASVNCFPNIIVETSLYCHIWLALADCSWIFVWSPTSQLGKTILCLVSVSMRCVVVVIPWTKHLPVPFLFFLQTLSGGNSVACGPHVGHWSAMFPGGDTKETQVIVRLSSTLNLW